MQRKKAILIVSGILLVAIVALLIVLTADQPGSGNLLGYYRTICQRRRISCLYAC